MGDKLSFAVTRRVLSWWTVLKGDITSLGYIRNNYTRTDTSGTKLQQPIPIYTYTYFCLVRVF